MVITAKDLRCYIEHLEKEERSTGTIEKYSRDIHAFAAWLDGREVTKELVCGWKKILLDRGQAPTTVNSKLSAINGLLEVLGLWECKVKFLKIQRKTFRESSRELTRDEFRRLVETAQGQGQERLALLLETICATGIRVSEVQYITVEATLQGRADIFLKGKIRTILLPNKLRQKLLKYAKKHKITSGEIFLTRSGKSLSRRQIWREMKSLCKVAEIEPSKVFPHNLRHLFATVFYRSTRDITKLADLLGHSSIETTRIYLITNGSEHARQLERLRLVC